MSALTVVHLDGVLVTSRQHYLFHNGQRITDGWLYPCFATALYGAVENSVGGFDSLPIRNVPGTCIVYQNWGDSTWGHVLIFMLPRLVLAERHGIDLSQTQVLASVLTPAWHLQILGEVFGIPDSNIVFFDPESERVCIESALIPQLPYRTEGFHPDTASLFAELKQKILADEAPDAAEATRVILIDRRRFSNPESRQRQATNFDEMVAALREVQPQLEVVDPSELSLRDQVRLFDQTRLLIGEYGSALHNSLFGRPGMAVVTIGESNETQQKICEVQQQKYGVVVCNNYLGDYEIPVDQVVERVVEALSPDGR